MSEIFPKHRRIVERLSMRINLRFDSISRSRDGHECPSYKVAFIAPREDSRAFDTDGTGSIAPAIGLPHAER